MLSKTPALIMLGLVIVLCIAGCAPVTVPAAQPTTAPPAPTSATAGAAEGNLVIYTPSSEVLTDPILAKWKERYPNVNVEFIRGGTGDLVARIRAEKERPLGDLMLGGSSVIYEANADLYEPVALPGDAMFLATDKNNIWHAFNTLPKPISVNTKLIAVGAEPKTIKELADPAWKGKVAFVNPRNSSTGYALVTSMVTLYGWEFVNEFLKNATVNNSSDDMFIAVRDGESAVGFIGEDVGVQWLGEGAPIKLVYPEDGVATEIASFGMIKGGPNPNAARAFMEFLQEKEIHELARDVVKYRSMHKEVAPLAGVPDTNTLKFIIVDAQWASAEREEILKMFDAAMAQAK